MAIDKSNTPTWMKAVLIALALIFVVGFCSMAASPLSLLTQPAGTGTAADPVQAVNQKHQAQVDALSQALQSDPESYTILVALGNSYFDWAAAMQQASQTSTSAVGADQPLWIAAKDNYARAVKINDKVSPVRVDYSITLFYAGDTNKAIEEATAVTKADPEFAPAWFNLGIFHQAVGKNAEAKAAYQRYIQLDPEGKQGNVDVAKQNLKDLESAPATGTK